MKARISPIAELSLPPPQVGSWLSSPEEKREGKKNVQPVTVFLYLFLRLGVFLSKVMAHKFYVDWKVRVFNFCHSVVN